jgi:hypothetical protein
MFHPPPHTPIPRWEPTIGDQPGSRYHASLIVAGSYPMHFEARQVTRDANGDVDGFTVYSDDFDRILELDPESRMRVATADELGICDSNASGDYLVFAYPWSE